MALVSSLCGMVGGVTENAFPVFSTGTDRLKEYMKHVNTSGITVASVQPDSVRGPTFASGGITARADGRRCWFFDHLVESGVLAWPVKANSISLRFADAVNYPSETAFKA